MDDTACQLCAAPRPEKTYQAPSESDSDLVSSLRQMSIEESDPNSLLNELDSIIGESEGESKGANTDELVRRPRLLGSKLSVLGLEGSSKLDTDPWLGRILIEKRTATKDILVFVCGKDAVRPFRAPLSTPTHPLERRNCKAPTSLFGAALEGPVTLNTSLNKLQEACSFRYAREMILQRTLRQIDSNAPTSELDFASISKLMKLLAATEGVLEGKRSPMMDHLMRSLMRLAESGTGSASDTREYGETKSAASKQHSNPVASLLISECVEHIRGATVPNQGEAVIRESLHPCYPGCDYSGDHVSFEGAHALRISFDSKATDLGSSSDTILEFFTMGGQSLKKFTGGGRPPRSFTVANSGITYRFKVAAGAAHTLHGFKFVARPLRGLGMWLDEQQVLMVPSFEWAIWLMNQMLESGSKRLQQYVRSAELINALQEYLLKPNAPFKSRVVLLLNRLVTDLSLLQEMPNFGVLQQLENGAVERATSAGLQISQALKPILELTLTIRASRRSLDHPQHAAGGPILGDDMAVPLVPPVMECKPRKADEDVPELGCYLDVIIMTQCLAASPRQRRLPDVLLMEIFWLAKNDTSAKSTLTRGERRELDRMVRMSSRFTARMDTDLIKLVKRKFSGKPSLLIKPHEITMTKSDRDAFILLADQTAAALQFRFATILVLNKRMLKVMGWLDFDRGSDIWCLGYRLRKLAHLTFSDAKNVLLKKAIDESWGSSDGRNTGKTVRLNPRTARESRLSTTDTEPGRSNCMFVQLHTKIKGWGEQRTKLLRCHLQSARGSGHQTLFKVSYENSRGIDHGGLYRDCMTTVTSDMWSDSFSLFKRVPNAGDPNAPKDSPEANGVGLNQQTFMPNSSCRSSDELFVFAGQMLGVSLRTQGFFEVRFPLPFYSLLLGRRLTKLDLASIDEAQFHDDPQSDKISIFTQWQNLNREGLAEAGLFFTAENIAGDVVELVPGGRSKPVTLENRDEFCHLYLQYRLHEFDEPIKHIRKGLGDVVPLAPLSLFTAAELEELIVGKSEVDLELWKRKTKYSSYSSTTPTVKSFWRVVEGFTQEQRSQLIRFAWGRSRLPNSDSTEDWNFRLNKSHSNQDHLPEAHTCFFQVDLPPYSTDELMKKRLLTAITFGAGDLLMA